MSVSIRVIGSLNADMVSVTSRFPGPGETLTATSFTTSAGGKGANQAVACGRLSRPRPVSPGDPSVAIAGTLIDVEMTGAVGALDAYFSSLLQPTLQNSGVGTSRIRTIQHEHTGVAVIIVDTSAGGENRILYSPGANYAGMQPVPDVIGLALSAPMPDIIVLQAEIPIETVIGILRSVRTWKKEMREAGRRGLDCDVEVLFNPAPAPAEGLPIDVYEAVDHLIMNETECEIMAPENLQEADPGNTGSRMVTIAEYFHGLGVRYVIITLGEKGVWYSVGDAGHPQDDSTWIRIVNEIPAAKAEKVVDTTGAGDTFIGAYAVKVARWREERRTRGMQEQDLTMEEKKARYGKVTEEAIQWATRASARCVERPGAMDSIPWEDEI